MEKKKGPTMTAPAPKSREEWTQQVMAVLNQVANRKPIIDKIQEHVDSIMALQSEVERVRLRENELVCAVDLGIQQLQQIQHTEGMLQEDVEIIEKMKKARQQK